MVEDVIREGIRRLRELQPKSAEDIRRAGHAMVEFSAEMSKAEKEVKRFLFARMYRHPDVLSVRKLVARITRELFAHYMATPSDMPREWAAGTSGLAPEALARRVCDFIAGMTDRYAIEEHRRLFDDTPDLG